ncbi:hypothetical protein CesoFtcFv8_000550 [Champsocephalus esox]|uniref:ZP domain-containing protein n=1 Tax=Champsocephalus esox TaxID=159716 RepID=A0AAN8D2Y9_9TELE|nr:hypothetical protein CesoFtcFv8_000550 [Champsocephalus esox]
MRASSCCWIRTRNGVSGWRFQTQVDLGSRSDTGKPNRSPDIAILPFLRVPQNCPRTYKLMSFDPDGDTVRCRYGDIRNIECSGCNLPSGFVLEQGSCSLHYRNAIANPNTCMAPRLSVNCLCNSPFLWTHLLPRVLMDSTCQSLCTQHPEDGQHINAEVNKEVEIRVRAQASHATLHDIIISGPLNITKHRSTRGDFVIRWTPGPDDVGDHYPICFAVESVIESGIYQSEMRCVLVNIGQRLIESHVTCHESSMTVEVERSSLPGLHEDHLRLSDPSNTACNLQTNSNSTHIIAVVPLNACGTQIEEDEENLVFKNEITTVDNIHDLVTRNHLLEVQFYCQYPKRGNVSQGFTAHRRNVVVWDKGFGKFTYEFEFYPDSQYRQMIDPGLYPLEYDVTNRIFMQIEAKSTVNNTQLFVESCSVHLTWDGALYLFMVEDDW